MNRGLIEAPAALRAADETTGLPRFMNRGLIEAIGPTRQGRSGRILPRFMNRGLIEARTTAGRNPCLVPDFPDS